MRLSLHFRSFMQVLAFPLRLRENGLLQRQDQTASIIDLLGLMARTPAGSWPGSPAFGLRDLFENSKGRGDVPRLAMARINEAFVDLGIEGFTVLSVAREASRGLEPDTYSITFGRGTGDETFTAAVSRSQ